MTKKPFENAPSEPKRRRTLGISPQSRRGTEIPDLPTVEEADITRLFNGQAFVMNRATALLREVEPRAQKLFVPVDEFAIQVRQALRRRGLDPNQIPFDLYKDMYVLLEKRARNMEFEVVGDLTGDRLVDHFKIKHNLKTGGRDLSKWEEFLMAMEPWLLWFMMNQLIGQFQAQEHQEACAAKTPMGTEVGPVQLRMAISMAAMMLVMGMQEEHVLFAVKQPHFNIPIPPADLINRARRLIESDGLHRELKEIAGAADPYLIIQYCDNHINRSPVGFEDWIAFRDLRNIRRELSISYVYAHQYSPGTREVVDYRTNVLHEYPTHGSSFPSPFGGGRGTRIVDPEAYSGMSALHYRSLAQQLSLADRNVSAIGGVLTSGFALDILCCFSRFMLKTSDLERIKRIRDLVAMAQGMMAGGLSVPMVGPDGMMSWVMQGLYQEMIAHIQRAFDHRIVDVTQWLDAMDPDLLEDLSYCPFILDLIQMISDVVGQLRNRLQSVVSEFLGNIEFRSGATIRRWGTLYDLRRGSAVLAILDKILAVAETCAKLDEDNQSPGEIPVPDPGEDTTFYDGVPRPLKLPPQVVDKFFRDRNPIQRPDGRTPIPAVDTMVSTQEAQVTQENFRKFCLGIVPDRVLDALFREE